MGLLAKEDAMAARGELRTSDPGVRDMRVFWDCAPLVSPDSFCESFAASADGAGAGRDAKLDKTAVVTAIESSGASTDRMELLAGEDAMEGRGELRKLDPGAGDMRVF
jgi:hypothetical protein